ncbi:hypothetical protein [Marinococcus luteus]|uniref:hypothetical protein n=1 Tax=Marinococcus luteus TaxID=1122204 RepID=UPI002ACC7F6A|nr:hypothetical protein [Marinococcus luteus]MDZ5782080.1 hypothetical protein [Marinococcus luteus]
MMVRHIIRLPPHFAQIAGRNGESREDKKRIYQQYVQAYAESLYPDKKLKEIRGPAAVVVPKE